jgi:hypothetical protein
VPVCWVVDPISRTVEVFEGDIDAEPMPPDGVLWPEVRPGFESPSRICGRRWTTDAA